MESARLDSCAQINKNTDPQAVDAAHSSGKHDGASLKPVTARIALCIPTYERWDMVEDFLIRCSEYYIAAGIDIYYYDSSVSNETEALLQRWSDGEHIHYVRMPSELHPNAKAYKIFQGYGLKKEYDFIWLSNDGLQCSRAAIEQLISNLSLEYDIIEIVDAEKDYNHVGTRTFTDRNEYMQNCAWYLGLFGAAILNVHTMLEGVDWKSYEERFLTKPVIYFSHVCFYFHRLVELNRFCAVCLCMPRRSVVNSRLKKVIGWARTAFYVVCEGWVQTIEGLPDCYTGKERVISEAVDRSFRGNVTDLYRYKVRGIYSMKVFLKYRTVLKKATSIPRRELFLAALIPRSVLKAFYRLRQMAGQRKLQRFCAARKRTVIYGTGSIGAVYAQCFNRLGISFEGFCVSRRKPKHAELDHPVYELAELKGTADNIGFVLAMDQSNVEEVLPAVKRIATDRDIFCDFKLTEELTFVEVLQAQNRLWD